MTDAERNSLTSAIAAFATDLQLTDIPDAIRRKTKLHILDTIGCGIAGASSELSLRMLDFLRLECREGPCPVFGTRLSFAPAGAAFGNAVAMNALDFDDGFEADGKGMGHPGATLVAAAVSAPFVLDVNGSAFLTSVVAAYEINNRLIQAMQPSIERFRQVYGVCQHQTVGAAIAFGKLTGMDAASLENAIGLAGTLSNVPSLKKYNWEQRPLISLKDFNAPAAEAGVRAVQLGTRGIVGSKAVLDGDSGLWRMLGSDHFDRRSMGVGLGSEWSIPCNSFKRYPACRWMHTALEAFEMVIAEHELSVHQIEEVKIHTSAAMVRDFMDRDPMTMVDAQFSFPFALAVLAHGVRPAARWYEAETMNRHDIRSFGRRVVAVCDPVIDEMMSGPARRPAGRVSVRSEGKTFTSALITHALGSAEHPMPDQEIVAKFLENATPVLGPRNSERLADRLHHLEDEPSVSALLSCAMQT